MAAEKAFLVPVVIDATSERGAAVPEKFHELQWTRLPGGETPPPFVERIKRLLTPDISLATTVTAAGPTSASAAAPSVHRPLVPKAATWGIGAIAAIAIAYFGVDRLWLSKRPAQSPSVASSTDRSQATAAPDKSIAVLPFVDMSEKRDQEYFADGMSEEILNVLAKIPELKVIGRTSSFQFKGKTDDLRKIGRALGASYVVEGSVRRSQDRLRVTAQLVDTGDGRHRWSNTFDARIDDALDVQQAIAMNISRVLQVTVLEGTPDDRSIGDVDGYDLYLRGLHALASASLDGCGQAIDLFSQLLRTHPRSKRILVSLAWAHECIGYEDSGRKDAGWPQAKEFAKRALQIDPQLTDAHVVLASVAIMRDYDWTAAEREISMSLSLPPSGGRAYRVAARLPTALGDFARAIEDLNHALALDPLDPYVYDQLGDVYSRQDRYRQAEEMYRRCLQITPNFVDERFWIGYAVLLQGRYEEALSEFELEPDEIGRYAGRALVLHALNRRSESDTALKAFIHTLETSGTPWSSQVARIHAFRGERDLAFEWLDKAYEQRDVDLYFIKGDPLLKNLAGDPRYAAFLRKMNLPE